MGTTRIKVIDLSSNQKEIKTARKHAVKLAMKPKEEKVTKEPDELIEPKPEGSSLRVEQPREPGITESKDEQETTKTTETISEADKPSQKAKTIQPSTVQKGAKPPHHKGKKYLDAQTLVDKNKTYPVDEALEILPKISFTRFDPTVEVHINVIDKNIRGSVNLPYPFSEKKEKKLLIFSDKKTEEKNVIWGNEKTIEQIEKGMLKPNKDFDIVYASPKFMPQLAKVAKVLGPAGMMPNPKNGTITDDPKKALAVGQNSSFEYRTEQTAPVIHTKIGKLSAKSDALKANLKAIIVAIGPSKISKATLKSTMSPGLRFDPSSL